MNGLTQSDTVYDIPLTSIDPPDIAMRQNVDEDALIDLTNSIVQHGLIQPITVQQRGERFVILAGHRRYMAHQMASLPTIKATVRNEEGTDGEVVKTHENAFREDVNPAEEAEYYKRLLDERCEGDVMKLVQMVGRKQQFVENRLDLLRGYPEVLDALKKKLIRLSSAVELNKFKAHDAMLLFLSAAIEGGASGALIRRWRSSHEALGNYMPPADPNAPALPPGQTPPPPSMSCFCCGGSKDPYNLEFIYIHRGGPCKDILENFASTMRP